MPIELIEKPRWVEKLLRGGVNYECDINIEVQNIGEPKLPVNFRDYKTFSPSPEKLKFLDFTTSSENSAPAPAIAVAFSESISLICDSMSQFADFVFFKLAFGLNEKKSYAGNPYFNFDLVAHKTGAHKTQDKTLRSGSKFNTQYSEQVLINIHVHSKPDPTFISTTMLEEIARKIPELITHAIQQLQSTPKYKALIAIKAAGGAGPAAAGGAGAAAEPPPPTPTF